MNRPRRADNITRHIFGDSFQRFAVEDIMFTGVKGNTYGLIDSLTEITSPLHTNSPLKQFLQLRFNWDSTLIQL